MQRLIPVGRIVRPHGIKGLLRIVSYSGTAASFTDVKNVFFRSASGDIRRFTVKAITPHKNVFLMQVTELCSADGAEAYRDAEILVEKALLLREPEAFFWQEILGLRVYTQTGLFLGRVSRIIPTGGHDIYVVGSDEKEVYLPATAEVINEITLETGKMVVSPTEDLLKLNEI